jgi:3-methyladenine DNA glycosylase AlkC
MEPLKEALYTRKGIEHFAAAFHQAYALFDTKDFLARVFDDRWKDLELKQRMRQITEALHANLPDDYREALTVLRTVAQTFADGGWLTLSLQDYIELYGIEHYDQSVAALGEFTPLCSSEFAVRPFIVRYPERMMAKMLDWADHADPAVRRLASEGCRPRLPWGIALPALKSDPSPILPILEKLKLDESETVRRSVSNNLNDISKDNPDVVLDLLRCWRDQHPESAEMEWILNQSLRTLLKSANPDALALLGFPPPEIAVSPITLDPEIVPMGETVRFSCSIQSQCDQPQTLMIDYVVYLMRANGKQNPKVFKLSRRTLDPGEVLTIERNHSFKPVTTRKYYPGEHAIQIQVNGSRFDRKTFLLVK